MEQPPPLETDDISLEVPPEGKAEDISVPSLDDSEESMESWPSEPSMESWPSEPSMESMESISSTEYYNEMYIKNNPWSPEQIEIASKLSKLRKKLGEVNPPDDIRAEYENEFSEPCKMIPGKYGYFHLIMFVFDPQKWKLKKEGKPLKEWYEPKCGVNDCKYYHVLAGGPNEEEINRNLKSILALKREEVEIRTFRQVVEGIAAHIEMEENPDAAS